MSVALQDMSPYARSIVERLGLETHPEGGWYTRDWQSPHTDEVSSRPLSSLIYFLLPEGDASAWHKVDADEVWLWHGPASVKLELGGSDETPESDESKRTVITLGSGIMRSYRLASGSAQCQARAMRWSPVWSVRDSYSTASHSNSERHFALRQYEISVRLRARLRGSSRP